MKDKGKIYATLSMIAADGRHVEIDFTSKNEARATMDALESGAIHCQNIDHTSDRHRLPAKRRALQWQRA